MSTAAHQSTTTLRDKGVRRPLGPINVNLADAAAAAIQSSSGKVEKTSHQRKLSNQSTRSDQSSTTISIIRSNPASVVGLSDLQSSFKPLDESPSIFRDPACEDKEDEEDLDEDVLSLKLADPVTDDDRDESPDDSARDHDDDISFPFTREDQTLVVESFDTRQLRSIFRRTISDCSSLDDRLENEGLTLKLANAITDSDDSESSVEESLLPSLDAATSDTDCDEVVRTQTLDWGALLSEQTLIVDVM